MLYEEQAGDISFALTGDSLISRRLSPYREPRYLEMVSLLRGADVSLTNAEVLFHEYEGTPTWDAGPGGTYVASDPDLIDELRWLGIDMVGCANNHALDYGEVGVLTNMRNLKAHGMPFAGMGRTLTEAAAPAYLDTPKGRVALLSVTCSLPAGNHRPGDPRGPAKGRPGVNVLRHEVSCTLPPAHFRSLIETANRLSLARGLTPQGIPDDAGEISFLGQKFVLGDEFAKTSDPNQDDLELNLRWVRDARRMADWVVVSAHSHERGATPDEPADFYKTFARACIDAGADVVFGHGPHQDRGIEIYEGRPIVYALGDFILQNDVVEWQPQDLYERYGLGPEATPADLYDFRSGNETRGQVVQPIRWQSAVVSVAFKGGCLDELRLYPVDLGFVSHKRSQRGRPLLAEGEVAQEILNRFRDLSAPFCTDVGIEGDLGVIRPR